MRGPLGLEARQPVTVEALRERPWLDKPKPVQDIMNGAAMNRRSTHPIILPSEVGEAKTAACQRRGLDRGQGSPRVTTGRTRYGCAARPLPMTNDKQTTLLDRRALMQEIRATTAKASIPSPPPPPVIANHGQKQFPVRWTAHSHDDFLKEIRVAAAGRNAVAWRPPQEVGRVVPEVGRVVPQLPPPPPPPLAECSICWEMGELLALPGCHHRFCAACIGQACVRAADEGLVRVPCPQAGCQREHTHLELANRMNAETMHRLHLNVERNNEFHYANCPSCRWRAHRQLEPVGFKPGGRLLAHLCEGLGCNERFCLRCGQLADLHEKGVCESALAQRDIYAKELQCHQLPVGKRCPNCLIFTFRDGGCDWIQCSRCKAEWCWECLHPHNHGLHAHYYDGLAGVANAAVNLAPLRRTRRVGTATKVVAAGTALVLAAPLVLLAAAASVVVVPVAVVAAVPVAAGFAIQRRRDRNEAAARLETEWKDWREKETARRNQLGLPAFGVDPPLPDEEEAEEPLLEQGIEMQVLS